ncbi:MAG TPA: alpha/beta hydrolase [Caulobacter sp.]|nr:alpha/beta hydrolase [Caulobacter sp.]
MTTATLANGRTIGFTDHGGDGPAVILLHSYLMNRSMFAPQVAAFGDRFRLIAVDERGHGETPGDEPFTFWDVAADVLALMGHLNLSRAAVVGTSQGGFVAMRMALTAPERVGAIAILGTSAAAEDPAIAETYRASAQAWRQFGPLDPIIDGTAAACLGAMPAEDWKAYWRTLDAHQASRNLEALVTRDDITGRLGELRCPVLVMHGSADAAYPPALGEAIASAVPEGRFILVEGGAHFLSLTDAEAVNPPLRAFLEQNATRG